MPPAPTNVQAVRRSPTSVLVTWKPPVDFKGIQGYRVYYSVRVMKDMSDWQSVETLEPVTQTTIEALDSASMYAIKVAAKSVDGRYGNLSEMTTTSTQQGLLSSSNEAVTYHENFFQNL